MFCNPNSLLFSFLLGPRRRERQQPSTSSTDSTGYRQGQWYELNVYKVFVVFPPLPISVYYTITTSVLLITSNMMSSQRDMFMDSSQESSPKLNSSLPPVLKYQYLWIVLFEWNVDVEHPFDLYQIGFFSTVELKPQWISGDLDELSRLKKLKFPSIPGKTFSLFAKVEKCKYNYYMYIHVK